MSSNNYPNLHDGQKHHNLCVKKPPVRNPYLKASKPSQVYNSYLKEPILESISNYLYYGYQFKHAPHLDNTKPKEPPLE